MYRTAAYDIYVFLKKENLTVLAMFDMFLPNLFLYCFCPVHLSYTGWKIDVSGLHKEGIVTFFIHHSILQFCVDTHRERDGWVEGPNNFIMLEIFMRCTIYTFNNYIQFRQIFWSSRWQGASFT